ncbi:MAG: hypothetical protein HZA93_18645 [Verrucomicrobia bacterium]|nr:hypothetical protein [Verrucomicrobiota bacterium]
MNQIDGTIIKINPPTREYDARALVRCPALMSPQNPAGIAAFYGPAWRSNSSTPHVGQRVVLSRMVEISRPSDPQRRWKALDAIPKPAAVGPRSTNKRPAPVRLDTWFTRLLSVFGIGNRVPASPRS